MCTSVGHKYGSIRALATEKHRQSIMGGARSRLIPLTHARFLKLRPLPHSLTLHTLIHFNHTPPVASSIIIKIKNSIIVAGVRKRSERTSLILTIKIEKSIMVVG